MPDFLPMLWEDSLSNPRFTRQLGKNVTGAGQCVPYDVGSRQAALGTELIDGAAAVISVKLPEAKPAVQWDSCG